MSRSKLLFQSSQGDGISIRDELGTLFEQYSRWGLIRKVRRSASGQLVNCPQCRKIGSQGHSLSHICDKCLGVGYIWDEDWIRYYQWPGVGGGRSSGMKDYKDWGTLPTNFAMIYIECETIPIEQDKIIQVAFDDHGDPLQPLRRTMMFDIQSIDDYRLDNGRLEYFRLACLKHTIGYYGQPILSHDPGSRRMP